MRLNCGKVVVSAVMFGPYELRGLLGRGGMGEVHLAFDHDQARVVALKLLPAQFASDEGFVERFRRESYTAAQLNDPHVIPIHRYGEIGGRLYIDMRLVNGVDLAKVIGKYSEFPSAGLARSGGFGQLKGLVEGVGG